MKGREMKDNSYWEPGMDAPIDCEYLGLEVGSTRSCIKIENKYKMVEASCVFDTAWDASERQQEIADVSLFSYGVQVFYAWKPDASKPIRCRYIRPTMEGTHILESIPIGRSLEVNANQIYGVYAKPKR